MTPIKCKCKWYPVSELAEEWNCSIEKILRYGVDGELQLSILILPKKMALRLSSYVDRKIENPSTRKEMLDILKDAVEKDVKLKHELIELAAKNGPVPCPLPKEEVLNLWEDWWPKAKEYSTLLRSIMSLLADPTKWKEYSTLLCSMSLPELIDNKSQLTVMMQSVVVTHEEKIRFEKECNPKTKMGNRERENLLRLIGALISQHYHGAKYRKSTDDSFNASTIAQDFHDWLEVNGFSDEGISPDSFRKLIPKAYDLIKENKKIKKEVVILTKKDPT